MNNFSFDDLGRKDLLIGLLIWIVIELVSFVLLPAIGMVAYSDRLRTWFILSLPFGIGGAVLMGLSSRFIAITHDRGSTSKTMLSFLGQLAGGLGLAGIVFPFVLVFIEIFIRIFSQ